jgi:hypothetical protein
MVIMNPIEIVAGDRIQMRKQHPCGSDEWIVYRTGADIGLRCVGCGRTLLLSRSALMKRMKRKIPTQSTAP